MLPDQRSRSPLTNCIAMFAASLVLLAIWPASAEIYKYRDANGNWQYSDTPPPGEQRAQTLDIQVRAPAASRDRVAVLEEAFQPLTAIERVTLAVVKIETPLSTGSGFFISETGYLVTNRHVVRPLKKTSRQIQKEIDQAERAFEKAGRNLRQHEQRLSEMKRELDEMQAYMARIWSDDEKAAYAEKYRRRRAQYIDYRKDVRQYRRDYDEKRRDFQDKKTSYQRKYANASVARRFKIHFKDDFDARARLVELSDQHDLALLKLEGYRVPYLPLAAKDAVRQGVDVYAVGSPLGLEDYVTRGIVTSIKKNTLVTDAQILPGNSGGPLVDSLGQVLGVNTMKILATRSIGSQGFGVAIRSALVQDAFPFAVAHRPPVDQPTRAAAPAEASAPEKSLRETILEAYEAGGDK